MPSSDSEDFESADEGQGDFDKKERKKRLSSSNYSDNALESIQEVAKATPQTSNAGKPVKKEKDTDGWEDFDVDDDANLMSAKNESNVTSSKEPTVKKSNLGWVDFDEDVDTKPTSAKVSNVKSKTEQKVKDSNSGWDDFDAFDGTHVTNKSGSKVKSNKEPVAKDSNSGWDDFDAFDDTNVTNKSESNVKSNKEPVVKDSNSGWDDFDDWGQDDAINNMQKQTPKPKIEPDADIKAVTDKMASASTGSGWGWSMHSLLNTATAGITTLTSQVSQGITTVLETSIGAPEPEELARKVSQSKETKPSSSNSPTVEQIPESVSDPPKDNDGAYLPFGSLLSGVTKFVETTGPKVISGGLDTLETIGKKTMEILQEGDPGLAKKRAMLGLSSEDKPVLSQVLREAREKAEQEETIEEVIEQRRNIEMVNYESLFNDFDGPVYLEALKLLSSQTSMRIEEQKRTLDHANRQAMEETLEMVIEIYELPEKEEEDEEESAPEGSKTDVFHERLQSATQDLSLKLQFQPLLKQYTEVLDWLSNTSDATAECIYKRAISALAQATSLSMHLYHKTSELILASKIRSTVDESTALSQLTVVLTKHISDLAAQFAEKLNSISNDNKDQVNEYITNIFLEAGNSSTYLENAFQLALPIVQIGAI